MSKIREAFSNEKAIAAFITCGDPDLETTAAVIREAVKNGADLIELGIPFSDPTAEGPVIQAANIRALNGGVTTDRIFTFVKDLRKDVTVPMVFMTYANVVFSYGAERFIAACSQIGIDGLVIPDLPYEEKDEFQPVCRRCGVDLISMIAPAPENRIAMIAGDAEGFIQIVSAAEDTLPSMMDVIRRNTTLPCIISSSFDSAETIRTAIKYADGVLPECAIAEILEKYGKDAPAYAGEYISSVKNTLM